MLRFGFIQTTVYRTGFFIELLVEFGYQLLFIVFFQVLLFKVSSIAGWSKPEILFLQGLNIIASEMLLSTVYLSLIELPDKVRKGDIDVILTKPIYSLFFLLFGKPYFSSFLSMITGAFVMWYAITQLHYALSPLAFFVGSILFVCGYIIGVCIVTISASLAFLFPAASQLPQIGERIVYDYKANPHTVYSGIVRTLFVYVIPVAFIASIPASIMLHGVNWIDVGICLVITSLFVYVTITIWNHLIRYYTSASS